MTTDNRSLTSQPQQLQKLVLSESAESKRKLDDMLLGCFALQKIYGKEPGALKAIIPAFHATLGKYPGDRVIRGLETWLERSQEFPTPADIVSLIKRNGKPPIKESDIIAIRKKEVCDWTMAEGSLVEEWDAQQQEGWREFRDQEKDEATLQENLRLRQQVIELRQEIRRLADLLHDARMSKGLERPKPSVEEKVRNTIAAMRSEGAAEADIQTFAQQYGMDALSTVQAA